MEKIDDHYLRRFYASCPSNKKTINNNSKQKKRDWLASRLCVTSKRTQAQHTKPKQTQKKKTHNLLNSTISSPIATGPLLRQSAKHTYLPRNWRLQDFFGFESEMKFWSEDLYERKKTRKLWSWIQTPIYSPTASSQLVMNQLEVVGYLK